MNLPKLLEMANSFMHSDFMDEIIVERLKWSIEFTREAIDKLEALKKSRQNLSLGKQQDLEDHWQDLNALTTVYLFFSGDYNLENLPEWGAESGSEPPGWEYWHEGDMS